MKTKDRPAKQEGRKDSDGAAGSAGLTTGQLRQLVGSLITEQRKQRDRITWLMRFTKKQLKVLRTVVRHSDRKLSVVATDYLHMHPRTLAEHLNRIYRILKVNSRSGMCCEAIKLGLV
ncbi:MAG: hypothetical protein ABI599_13575 [Flavobacteriales bacterium]